ncbi:leucine-rich repeat protein [Aquiluna sp. Uisw_065]|uniref:leucine-rich repeat protein n=1 Tax=Aquiluna sp. Uisw_065 TaxID=3230967 RepID=UPI0039EBEA8E
MKTLRGLSIGVLFSLVTSVLIGPAAWAEPEPGYCTTGTLTIANNVVTDHTNCSGTANIPFGVTRVGDQAFLYANLTSVTIPSTVTSIGTSAFYDSKLTSITIPSSVISIGPDAFVYSGNLASVNFEGNAPTVGSNAFSGTKTGAAANIGASAELFGTGKSWNGLRVLRSGTVACTTGTFTIANNVVTGQTDCAGAAIIPNGVTSIGDSAFDGASSLTSIIIPKSVNSIGNFAFRDNTTLEALTFEGNAPAVGFKAFYSIGPDPTANIGASAEFFGAGELWNDLRVLRSGTVACTTGAFTIANNVVTGHTNCSGTAIITDGVTTIGDQAFKDVQLTSIAISKSVTSIGEGAFDGASSLKAITIPKSVISIGNFAFRDNTALQAVTFETDSKITSLAYKLFWGATALSTITIPNSVTEVGEYAFYQATSLASITIPSSVTSIREGAFIQATSLASITFDGNAPSASDAFNNGKSGAVAIISSSATGFTSDPWNLLKLAVLRNVTFNENGGTGTMSSQVAAVTTALSTNAFSRVGFTFAGWNTVADGTGGVSYSPGAGYSFASNATLYAQWTAITYSVTFNENGGTGTMSSQVAAVTTALSTNAFSRVGFTFAGWNTVADGTGGVSYSPGAGYSFASNATLYAQWTAIPAPPSPRFSEPAPNPSPLKTTAPEPTPPTQRASTPGGTVADSAEKLIISAGTSGETITARGSDWQLEIASVQGNGKANPATGDSNLVFQPSSKVELSANGLMPSAKVAFWVFSDPTFVGEVETDSTGKFESNLVLPDGLAPGEHTLQVLSRDSKGRAITLNFPILVQGEVAYETASISQKLNAGPFNRSIAVYAKGHKGKTLSWKIAGKWSRKTITSDYQVFQRRTAAVGLDVNVHLYIDGKKQSTMTVRTR